jgi:hypothetical protein
MIDKIIHVMPKSMAMTSSGRVLLSDIIKNAGTRKTEGAENGRVDAIVGNRKIAELVYTDKEESPMTALITSHPALVS